MFSVPVCEAQISREDLQKGMTTRHARARSEEMTMQQLMGMMQGLQEAMAASKAKQERTQAKNDELHRANEELRCGWRNVDEPEAASPPREFATPGHLGVWAQEVSRELNPNVSQPRKGNKDKRNILFVVIFYLLWYYSRDKR